MGNISDNLSFAGRNRDRFKDGLIDFYLHQGFSHVLTLCWNADFVATNAGLKSRIELARRDIRELMARVDRSLLGTRFHRKAAQRTKAVFHFEHVGTNIHVHATL